ncbi:toll-like receptor 4 [Dendroctonus ponderosae]|uniref:toll-like receptor 4 n=1 Tax=Dendroctonus ponderosae TaxID=77166 RepID=UPI0020358066|nr:toll-like receptor 4 [Dendroctonus ponderosae]
MFWLKTFICTIILISTFKDSLAKCHVKAPHGWIQDECEQAEEPDSGYLDITCHNTTIDDYLFEMFELDICRKYLTNLRELRITNSKFPNIYHLLSPTVSHEQPLVNVSSLSLNFCGINHVAGGAFNDMKGLKHLDLGSNNINKINFVSNLPETLKDLNLTNNKITNVDFKLFCSPLKILDLSFNQIAVFELPKKTGFWSFPVKDYLYLNNNCIKKIEIHQAGFYQGLSNLNLNLANNNLTSTVANSTDTEERSEVHFHLLNLSQSLTDWDILMYPKYRISSTHLIVSGNSLVTLDKKLSTHSKIYGTTYIDFSKCSLTNINPKTFQGANFMYLNFSYNNFTILNDYLFTLSNIELLDLSHNRIENIVHVFHGAAIRHLKLSYNKIMQLNDKSFESMRFVYELDLSFNNISLNKNSFANVGNSLSNLSLASNYLTQIDDEAFYNLSKLLILNLENNLLETIESVVFQPLKSVREINLANNKLTTITSQLFSNLPLTKVTISRNCLETIQSKSFHRLNYIEEIHIDENHGMLTIERAAFSELSSSNPLNIYLKHSKVAEITSDMFYNITIFNLLDLTQSNVTSIGLSSNVEHLMLTKLIVTFNGVLHQKSFLATPFLQQLVFCNSSINNIEERAFQGLFNLTVVEFQNSTIQNLSIGALRGLFSLQTLEGFKMFQNQIALNSSIFQDLYSLSYLNLSHLKLQNLKPHTFHGLKQIQVLNLSHNELSYFWQSTFSELCFLRVLDLSYNKINVLEREDFHGLDSLKMLNLNDNNIRDIALGSFQNIPQLQSLLIANNNLTQIKIGTFSNLASLKELDIQNNCISELLFESFLPLVALESLNLEFNNLKKITLYPLVSNLQFLKRVRIANNKWKCEFLAELIATFRKRGIDYTTENRNFYEDNIDGIRCIDVCKFLLCLQDSHGIN